MREATVWSVAVNGVMAGCRPQYMPILVAIAEILSDPAMNAQDFGSTTGYDPYIILSGPIARQLGFESGVALLRGGDEANSTVSRFQRLYLRNISGFVPGGSDKGCFGRMWTPVLVEDEVNSPWAPFRVSMGYGHNSNIVAINGVHSMTWHYEVPLTTAETMIDGIAYRLTVEPVMGVLVRPTARPMLVISPIIANKLAGKYTKERVQELLFEKARISLRDYERQINMQLMPGAKPRTVDAEVTAGNLPAVFSGTEPNRMVPMYMQASDLWILVMGDYLRNRMFATNPSGTARPTIREIKLPANWNELVPKLLD